MAVVQHWDLLSADGKSQYGFEVHDDGTLWLVEGKPGTGAIIAINYDDVNNVMPGIRSTLATVNAALAICQAKKTIGSGSTTITLACDLPYGHASNFHHDPTTSMYWLSDS